MAGAWADGYFISYRNLGSNPSLGFQVRTSGQVFFPWMWISEDIRFDVIKAQLDTGFVYVEWNDITQKIEDIIGLNL